MRSSRGWTVQVACACCLALVVSVIGGQTSPAGALSEDRVEAVANAINGPADIVAGPDGNLWFTNFGNRSIGRITTDGVVTTFGAGQINGPVAIAAGPDGNVWFTDRGEDRVTGDPASIGRITPAGVVTKFTDARIGFPVDIVAGPDGNLWFTNVHTPSGGVDAIGRITPEGVMATFPDAIFAPEAIAAGPDGNLWFVNRGGGSIGRITPAGVVTNFTGAGISDPGQIAPGPDGNVWFTNQFDGSIGRITPAGAVSTFTGAGISSPRAIASGADGNLWFVNQGAGGGSIGRITPEGSASSFTAPGLDDLRGLAAGPDGNLWFANRGEASIGRITPAGVFSNFNGAAISDPVGITPGPDGNLWFVNRGSDSIGRITPAGVVATFTGEGIVEPADIVAGPDGNLWFTDPGQDAIGRITPGGVVSTFVDDGISHPAAITAGPDGNLWFVNYGDGGSIGRITPAGVVSSFTGDGVFGQAIVAGPDGNVWFSNSEPSQIGRITPDGEVTLFTDGISFPGGLAAGPDGNVWFTNVTTDSVGMITPDGIVTDFAAPGIGWPYSITAGADGSLWFVNVGTERVDGWPTSEPTSIGRITTAGELTTFVIPFDSYPQSITAGPDGNVWFTRGDHAIGRVLLPGVPGAPSGVIGEPGNGSVSVSWGAVANLSTVTAYTVTAAPGGATCTWSSGPPSCVVTGLTNGTAYTFTVTATNDLGTGAESAASAAVVPTRFPDVPFASAFYAEIEWLVGRGITDGYGDGTFRPLAAVSRQAMAAFLYRQAGSPNGPAPTCDVPPFVDVGVDAPFCGEITWLVEQGITVGYPDGGFHPAAPVSRQAMAAFLHRSASEPSGQDPACLAAPFSDVAIDDQFCSDIAWLVANDIAEGYDDGTFRPLSSVSRQAMAAFLQRLDAYQHP